MRLSILLCGSLLGSAQLLAQQPEYRSIAPGCPGQLGTPDLRTEAGALPIAGRPFLTRIQGVPQTTAIGILGLSTERWLDYELPLELGSIGMPGCYLHCDVRMASILQVSNNQARWQIDLPEDPAWIGHTFYQQAFVLDPSVPGLGAVLSEARQGVIAAPQEAPFASIDFPPPLASTTADSILVRGQAYD
ncbi:MAG: hypothetical protein ACYTG5_20805, partial [Planctomycetota bacterium]